MTELYIATLLFLLISVFYAEKLYMRQNKQEKPIKTDICQINVNHITTLYNYSGVTYDCGIHGIVTWQAGNDVYVNSCIIVYL